MGAKFCLFRMKEEQAESARKQDVKEDLSLRGRR